MVMTDEELKLGIAIFKVLVLPLVGFIAGFFAKACAALSQCA
jgi:hypothetical protein